MSIKLQKMRFYNFYDKTNLFSKKSCLFTPVIFTIFLPVGLYVSLGQAIAIFAVLGL